MARKNRVRNGRAEREHRKKKAAERQAEYDSLNAFQQAERRRLNFEKYEAERKR